MTNSTTEVQDALHRILDSTKQLPSPPEICVAVTAAADDNGTSLEDLQTLVESDIALAGRLMQVANSSFFGIREQVTSVRRAIALLGFGTVRSLALGFIFNEEFGKLQLPGLPYPSLPRFALAASVSAETIAETVDPAAAASAGCLGLLHESGVIVMAKAFGPSYRKLLTERVSSGEALHEAEKRILGVDHATAGKLLLTNWRLCDAFTAAVEGHHRRDVGDAPMDKVIKLASSMAMLFFGAKPDAPGEAELAGEYFSWSPEQFATSVVKAAETYRARTAIIGLEPEAVDRDARAAMAAVEPLLATSA